MTYPRDNLAAILGLAILHENRYGPAAKALLAEIADEARKGIGALAPKACMDCLDTGIYAENDGVRCWPCRECNADQAQAWDEAGMPFAAPLPEVRAWLDARKAPRLGEVRDDAKPSGERRTA